VQSTDFVGSIVYAWIAVRIPRFVPIAAAFAIACTARPSLPLGSDCELASQCAAPLVCRLGRCREECRSDRDCRAGLVCLRDHGLGACELEGEACVRNSDCPATLVCLMGRCANACNADLDCPPGARCLTDATGAHGCRDTFMMHCTLNSDCAAPLVCANDGVCRQQCLTTRDCRDGRVCDATGTCVWPSTDGAPSDATTIDGGNDASNDAAMNDVGLDLGLDAWSSDVGIDAFASVDMGRDMGIDVGLDMGIDAGPMIDTGCIDVFAPDAPLYDSGILTGPSPPSQIAGGASHTCAIQLGSLRCWGDNSLGQLGDGGMTSRNVSAPVATIAATATTVTSGRNFACATTASAIYCWGENALGQVGNGGMVSPQPMPVMISAASATTITAGADHTCILRGGVVSCWGDNSFGQIGDGTTMPRPAPTPTLALARPAVALDAGGRTTCAVLDDGRIQCWGANGNGELGNGTVNATANAMPSVVSSISDAVEVVVGTANACARRAGGEVLCWGDNMFGELGDGSTSCVAQRATPGLVGTLPPAVELNAGLSHVCARATDGSVWCWGDNTFEQTGQPPSTFTQVVPHAVNGVSGATQIGTDETASCARVAAGIVCWGDNGAGQLGNGSGGSGMMNNMPQTVMWP
jgi:alpha-tubulin suppressor-like RCC1 family protein